jgi:hypothetical protein
MLSSISGGSDNRMSRSDPGAPSARRRRILEEELALAIFSVADLRLGWEGDGAILTSYGLLENLGLV